MDNERKFYKNSLITWENKLRMYQKDKAKENDFISHFLNQLDPKVEQKVIEKVDDILLYTYHILQSQFLQNKFREEIVEEGLVFNENIPSILQMKQLRISQLSSIVMKQYKKTQVKVCIQGGLIGTLGHFYSMTNVPFQIINQLRFIQYAGLTFGYEMNSPYEMFLALKVLVASMLPRKFHYECWNQLKIIARENNLLELSSEKHIIDKRWAIYFARQLVSLSLLNTTKKNTKKRLAPMSLGIGILVNYLDFKYSSAFIMKFYQYRFLMDIERKKSLP